jgi:glc operon protein GlcG
MTMLDAVRADLDKSGRGASVAVVDAHGELVAFLRTDGCRLSSIEIAINKAYTAAREQFESKAVGNASKREAFPMTNFGSLRYVTWGGGVPIKYEGVVVGAVGVSGLPEEDDMELARMAVAKLEGTT